jgi:hypothetical protein
MSPKASWKSPIRVEVSPVDSSGSDVAAASTVAPNTAPESLSWPKNSSPLRSRAMPATRVATAATAMTSVTRPVPRPFSVACRSFSCLLCPRGSSWPPGHRRSRRSTGVPGPRA